MDDKHEEDRPNEVEEEPGDGPAVSMVDVLAEEQQLEDDANAVLGASDSMHCTYLMGYVPRQALYACRTCCGDDKDPAGVCLACSLDCHEGHEFVELYTKRNFRCDCGNSKFGERKCNLVETKCPVNADNIYNQNYKGTYCICNRPYPDPEEEVEDEMIQCVICEDWLHGRHLGSKVPESDNYDEMICASCMAKNDFLWAYILLPEETETVAKSDTAETSNVDVGHLEVASTSSKEDKLTSAADQATPSSSEPTTESTSSACKLESLSNRKLSQHEGATFWQEKWRRKLCSCKSCLTMYEQLRVEFLVDEGDSIKFYEELGKAQSGSQYESGLQVLSSMDRVQQVEMMHGYNDMKSELTEYFKKFVENKKVVREEDIKEFFEGLGSRKKQKKSGAPQHYCK